jgi:transcriptional regulator
LNKELNKIVGKRIKTIRRNLGFTMEQFGNELGTTKAVVNNWEKGRNLPNKANLLLIANIAKVKVETLLSEEEPSLIQLMIEGFEATCYELSDEIKAKLLASDPNVARDKIMDLYACRLAGRA